MDGTASDRVSDTAEPSDNKLNVANVISLLKNIRLHHASHAAKTKEAAGVSLTVQNTLVQFWPHCCRAA